MLARLRRVGSAREAGLAVLLLVVYGWAFPFFPRLNNPNELVRVYMARAIAEEHTYAIGFRTQDQDGKWVDHGPIYDSWGYVNDKALVCDSPEGRAPDCAGTLYAAKAPGASFAAVPVVSAVDRIHRALLHRPASKDLQVLSLRWILSILPTVLAWLAIRRFLLALGVGESVATLALLAGGLGSLSLTYGQMFAGHQLASLGLMLAFLAAFWPPPALETGTGPEIRAILVGLGAALAISAEFQAAPAAAIVVGGWVLARRPPRRLLGWVIGGAFPSLFLTARFHAVAFGAPWRTAYGHLENATFVRDLAAGSRGFSWPTWQSVDGSLLSPRLGLLYWAPWIALVAVAGSLARRRVRGDVSSPASSLANHALRVACLVVGYYVLFQITHVLWRSGWTVGPRYVTPLAPFAAIAVGLGVGRAPRRLRACMLPCFAGAGAAAILATGLTSLVGQGFPPETAHPLVQVVAPLLEHGYVARNPLQALGVPGIWSALPTLAALAVAIVLCLRAPGLRPARRLALVLFLLLTAIQWTWPGETDSRGEGVASFLAQHWTPERPPGSRPFESEDD
jgi:hypothetical protein